MQMYKVAFQTHYENLTDIGTVLVCANSAEHALMVVRELLGLPGSRSTCKAERVKPSLYILERREVRPEKKPSARNYGQARETMDFNVKVNAVISGTDEKHAMRRLAGSLIAKGNSRPAYDAHTKQMMVDCNEIQPEKRVIKGLEAVELYQAKSFIGGNEKYAKGKR